MKHVTSFAVAGRRLDVIGGSLTTAVADVIVSSDDNILSHGGGVSAALWEAAGAEVEASVDADRPKLRLGDVWRSPAGRLRADHLLHAVTIDFDTYRRLGLREAVLLYGRVLDEVRRLGCDSVAMPLLGAGAGRLGTPGSAVALVSALEERAAQPGGPSRIVLHVLDHDLDVVRAEYARRLRSFEDAMVASEPTSSDPGLLGVWLVDLLGSLVDVGSARVGAAAQEGRIPSDAEHELYALRAGKVVLPAEPARMSAGALLRTAEELHAHAGTPLPRVTVATLSDSVAARNVLTHGTAAGTDLVRNVQRGVETLVATLPQNPVTADPLARPSGDESLIGFGLFKAAGVVEMFNLARAALRNSFPASVESGNGPTAPEPSPTAAAPPSEPLPVESSGTGHVRRLHRFLLETLAADQLDELAEWLHSAGYRGDRDLRILEHCVSVADPVDFLANQFTSATLRREFQRRTGERLAVDTTTTEAASRLLEYFGYPITRRIRGLQAEQREVDRLRRAAREADLTALTGGVTQAASRLESVAVILLRFVCRVVHEESAEHHFQALKMLEPGRSLEKCSLGSLLSMLERLSRELEEGGSRVDVFRHDFGTDRLAPLGAAGLAAMRNDFAHFHRARESRTLSEARLAAGEFYDRALELLAYLGRPEARVFPYLVHIEQVTTDRWGRRVIVGKNDEDQVERIFTDMPLHPGETYFMHPLTNPLRVDPILVPAGDLGA